ncbi:hypothetical protein B0H14DRAFT_3564756 [Mycena olivaceomarginata]|nr:hypothetical protein B0H14DRAFT_3564756 [Mycena olivaceomarginata]
MRRLIAFFLPPFTRRSYPYLDSGTMLMPKTFDWKSCAGALVCLTVCAERREWDPVNTPHEGEAGDEESPLTIACMSAGGFGFDEVARTFLRVDAILPSQICPSGRRGAGAFILVLAFAFFSLFGALPRVASAISIVFTPDAGLDVKTLAPVQGEGKEALGVFGLEMRMRLSTFVHFEEQEGEWEVEAAGEGGGGGCLGGGEGTPSGGVGVAVGATGGARGSGASKARASLLCRSMLMRRGAALLRAETVRASARVAVDAPDDDTGAGAVYAGGHRAGGHRAGGAALQASPEGAVDENRGAGRERKGWPPARRQDDCRCRWGRETELLLWKRAELAAVAMVEVRVLLTTQEGVEKKRGRMTESRRRGALSYPPSLPTESGRRCETGSEGDESEGHMGRAWKEEVLLAPEAADCIRARGARYSRASTDMSWSLRGRLVYCTSSTRLRAAPSAYRVVEFVSAGLPFFLSSASEKVVDNPCLSHGTRRVVEPLRRLVSTQDRDDGHGRRRLVELMLVPDRVAPPSRDAARGDGRQVTAISDLVGWCVEGEDALQLRWETHTALTMGLEG